MGHGDDDGLVVPPRVAPVQVVVMPVREDDAVLDAARDVGAELDRAGVRARCDDHVERGFGRRVTGWELKGVPLRAEIGPRDLASGQVELVRRDTGERLTIASSEVARRVPELLTRMQDEQLAAAEVALERRIADVAAIGEAREAARTGFARIPWRQLGEDGEAALAADGITVRCLQTSGGEIPDDVTADDVVAVVGRGY